MHRASNSVSSWRHSTGLVLKDGKERLLAKVLRRQARDGRDFPAPMTGYVDPVTELLARTAGGSVESGSSKPATQLYDLPMDLVLDILDLLGRKDSLALRLVNRYLSEAVAVAFFRTLRLVYHLSLDNNYQVCPTHGAYDGILPPCSPRMLTYAKRDSAPVIPLPRTVDITCGYESSAVAKTAVGAMKMDYTSAPLVLQAQTDPNHVLFRYTREFIILFSSAWYEKNGADRTGGLVTFAEHGMPVVLDAMPNVRTVRVFIRPRVDGAEHSRALERFCKALCSHCSKRGLALHLKVKVSFGKLAKWAAAADFIRSLEGIASIKLTLHTGGILQHGKKAEDDKDDQERNDIGRDYFELEVAEMVMRSPMLKQPGWTSVGQVPPLRDFDSRRWEGIYSPHHRLRWRLGDPQTKLQSLDDLKMRDTALPYSRV